MCVPQGTDVEGHSWAEAGQHGQPEVGGRTRARGHRGGHRTQAETGRGLGWGRQLPHGARLQRRPVSVLLRVQGADAAPDGQGEGVGRLDVALAAGLGGAGAQELLRVLKVRGVGHVPLPQGAFLIGSIRVDGHGSQGQGSSGLPASRWVSFLWMEMLDSSSSVVHWEHLIKYCDPPQKIKTNNNTSKENLLNETSQKCPNVVLVTQMSESLSRLYSSPPSTPRPLLCCEVLQLHPRCPGLLLHQGEGCDGAETMVKYALTEAGVVRKSCPFTHGAIGWMSVYETVHDL